MQLKIILWNNLNAIKKHPLSKNIHKIKIAIFLHVGQKLTYFLSFFLSPPLCIPSIFYQENLNDITQMSPALSKTVFIVDDSMHIVNALTTMLSELDRINIVGFAREAAEASFCIHRLQPDIVILDIQLQRGTGIDVLEEIKKKKPAPIAIMLTNYPTEPYRTKCQSLGADYFFDKTSEFEKVADVCQSLVH